MSNTIIRCAAVFFCLSTAASPVLCSGYELYERGLRVLLEKNPIPSIASVASGFGPSGGSFFTAVSYSDRDLQTEIDGDDDGSISLGFGLGDPEKFYGGEVTIGITSVSTSFWGDGKFGDEGNFNFKLHKRLKPLLSGDMASFAVGASNIVGWGGTREVPTNKYFVYSETDSFGQFEQYGVAYSLGFGSAVAGKENKNGIFGGVSVARSQLSTSLSFLGDEFHYSIAWQPTLFGNSSITLTRADIFNDSGQSRNILTLGYSYNFRR